MEAVNTVAPPVATGLEEIAHKQVNSLYDVVALLTSIVDRIDAHSSVRADDAMHHTLRLATIAREKVNGVIDAFDAHI